MDQFTKHYLLQWFFFFFTFGFFFPLTFGLLKIEIHDLLQFSFDVVILVSLLDQGFYELTRVDSSYFFVFF